MQGVTHPYAPMLVSRSSTTRHPAIRWGAAMAGELDHLQHEEEADT